MEREAKAAMSRRNRGTDNMTKPDETSGFKIAYQEIESLLKRLDDKRVCPCCIARALSYHAASMVEDTLGGREAAEIFEDFARIMRENDIPPPEPMPSTQTH